MTNDLRERLADLAEDGPTRLALGADVLWTRGVRRRRRDRALTGLVGVAAAGLVAALVLGGGGLLHDEPDVLGRPAEQGLGLPDRIHAPSPWLEGTDEAGEIGPLVAVVPARRGALLGGGDPGLVGISGRTGEYRFLDLDRPIVPGTTPSLSADGRYVAWWWADMTVDLAGDLGPYVQGWAAYDTVTGQQHVEDVAGDLGSGFGSEVLAWSGEELWIQYLVWDGGGDPVSGRRGTMRDPQVWTAREGVVDLPALADVHLDHQATPLPAGGLVWAERADVIEVTRAGVSRLSGSLGPDAPGTAGLIGPVMTDDGETFVGLASDDPSYVVSTADYPVVVGHRSEGGIEWQRVRGDQHAQGIAGWREPGMLVIHAEPAERSGRYTQLELDTGSTLELMEVARTDGAPVIAADAWRAPTYAAPEPDWPMDPRVVPLVGVIVTCVAFVVIRRWRPRGRA